MSILILFFVVVAIVYSFRVVCQDAINWIYRGRVSQVSFSLGRRASLCGAAAAGGHALTHTLGGRGGASWPTALRLENGFGSGGDGLHGGANIQTTMMMAWRAGQRLLGDGSYRVVGGLDRLILALRALLA
jgi:hypothetical protein